MKQSLINAIYDTWYGLWSRIPICCVYYFVVRVLKGRFAIAYEVRQERGGECSPRANYVQCDRCYKNGRVVKIRKGRPDSWIFYKLKHHIRRNYG